MDRLAQRAKSTARLLAASSTKAKNDLVLAVAAAISKRKDAILAANGQDIAAVKGRTTAFVDRLKLDEKSLRKVIDGVRAVAKLDDPVGRVTDFTTRPNGLVIKKMRVPLGVIAILYESRPGVTADAAALCLKSGNACLLRGGKEAIRTNSAIADAIEEALTARGLDGAVGFVRDPDRAAVKELLQLDKYIDLVIPRGGPELTVMVRKESSIAVLSHDKGLVHAYVDASADLSIAEEICFNAKVERPGVCNAMETLLVHEKIAKVFLPQMAARYEKAGVALRGDEKTRRIIKNAQPATEADWDTEYLDLILSVKVVASYEEAVAHIAAHGSGLAEAIVTQDVALGRRFQREVDAGAVYVNASTRFTDGGEFGLGAEMGISTQKVHARGPVGLEGLTCEKFVVTGSGQVRDSRA